MTLADDYFKYTKEYSSIYGNKTLVLMQVGSFFECYAMLKEDGTYSGSHIQEFVNINDMCIAKKNICVGNYDIVMAGFGLPQLEKYVKKMLNHGYTVVVFTQDNQSKNTTRSLECIYSPGTFFNNTNNDVLASENNFNEGLSNNTITIWIHLAKANNIIKENTLTIGLSIIDILTGKLINYEYSHSYINSPTTYDQLEKYIAIYNPTEVIIITNVNEENYIDNVISFANINANKFHKIYLTEKKDKTSNLHENIAYNCEKQRYQEALIDKIYGIGSFKEKSEFHEYAIANQSLCFLLDFIEKHNPYLIKNIEYPIFENHCNRLILANHSLKQLNIISDQRYNGKLSCVANFLNNCITNSGKRKFNYNLLHPINDINESNKSYNVIEHLLTTNFHKEIRNYLTNIRDIEKIERKIAMKSINPRDFFILHSNLSKIENLFLKIKEEQCNLYLFNYIQSYINEDIISVTKSLNSFIENHFNLEKASTIVMEKLSNYDLENLDFINKKYNNDLNILFKNSIDSREQFEAISQYFSELISIYEKPKSSKSKVCKNNDELNYVKIHETSKNDAMLIATKRRIMILKESIQKIIKNEGKDIGIKYKSKYSGLEEILTLDLSSIEYKIHGNNHTNLIIFSPHINEIANSIQNSKDILVDGLTYYYNIILREFIEENSNKNNSSKLSIISQFIGLIDLIHCKAYNAEKYNYTKPIIFDNNYSYNEDINAKSYIRFTKMRHCLIEHLNTNELYVSNDLSLGELHNGMLLYGTNAVGKTSFIKSIGIALILAQSGMYVPCEEFTYYPYNYLFTRILGNDNIFKGLSTFAVEMCELRTILKYATQNSIILGDELCSGTESTSALSIFVSSLEKLHNLESTFLFATHFHEILQYNEIIELTKLKTYHMSVVFDREKNTLIYDRKLNTGPGEFMYGLEVCKSLDMPDDFIERAYEIRNKYNKDNNKIMSSKKSRYNSKKLRGKCELCNLNEGSEVHHLQFQKNANKKGIINGEFNKNHKANLINICESCHQKIHNSEQEFRINKTNNGYQLCEI